MLMITGLGHDLLDTWTGQLDWTGTGLQAVCCSLSLLSCFLFFFFTTSLSSSEALGKKHDLHVGSPSFPFYQCDMFLFKAGLSMGGESEGLLALIWSDRTALGSTLYSVDDGMQRLCRSERVSWFNVL